MPESIQELFEAVRDACSSGAWSRGVDLVRTDGVCGESEEGGEVVLRVTVPGRAVSQRVVLMPDDGDWECDCSSREDACEHVAASLIALRRARGEGRTLPGGGALAPGTVGYRLRRIDGALAFERCIVHAAEEVLLTTSLGAVVSGRVSGPRVAATGADLEVERALGTRLRGRLPPGVWPTVLAALSRCPDVRLDGEPVQTSTERLGWVGVLDDADPGFRLSVRPDPRIDETFDSGVVRAGTRLCLRGESRLTGREKESLKHGRLFDPDRAAELVTEILPNLRERVVVEIRTGRLPTTERMTPRLVVEVAREGDALGVLPLLMYGDPPRARVDAGRLVPLGDGPLPLRDEDAERALVRRAQRELELAPGHRLVVRGAQAVALAKRLEHYPGVIRGNAHRGFFEATALTPRFEPRPAGFELDFESPGDPPRRAAAGRVLEAWRAGESLVPLEGGGLAPLPADWLARHGERVADLLAAREPAGEVPPVVFPDLARLCEDLDAPVPPDVASLRDRLERTPPSSAIPDDCTATLRDYQRDGVAWLAALRDAGLGALLADDMGLGKTLQALCALRGRCLVVAPTSVLHNWNAEILRFRPALRAALYHGSGRRLDADADVTLTTWAILRLDVDTLADVEWDTLVLDEAQAIKNPVSQVARAAYRLRAGFRIALTGTPVENRLEELWSQLHATHRGLLGGRSDFDRRYAKPIAAGDPVAGAHLRERIRPYVLRRLKRDVAPELPPRTEVVLRAPLRDDERAVYDSIRVATRRDVVEKLAAGSGVLQALEALLRLRQAACHPALVPGQTADSSSKLELLLDRLEQAVAEGHKALVFSQWTSLLDLVEPHLARQRLPFGRLDGATRDRAGVVATFQGAEGPPVLLLSLRAGGIGLNLTAADSVFILDPWWNPAAEAQAADRAHRIGQDKPVMVYRLVAENTVEEGILALQERKRGLADAALGGVAGRSALTRDELLELLA